MLGKTEFLYTSMSLAEHSTTCSAIPTSHATGLPRLIFAVTAHHEAYGSVAVYAQDVSFCSFSWPKGEMCGTKITAVTQVGELRTPLP